MPEICLCFEVHQPFRLDRDFFWERKMFKKRGELFDYYFSEENRSIFEKIAAKCYIPSNNLILSLLDEHKGEFKVTFSLSGVFIEQCKRYGEEVMETFRELAKRKDVEFLSQTYYHSLTSLYEDPSEFVEQINLHRKLMKQEFKRECRVFENTELLYNNKIASIAANLGYKGIFAEGIERVASNPNFVYKAKGADIKVLLRNYQLTDDIGFRFSSKKWEGYPLTANKYSHWLAKTPGDCINIFADYETFGEHQWSSTGIFEFLKHLPGEVLKWENLKFSTPSEIIDKYEPKGEIDVFEVGGTTSWADLERDISCWLGNNMQRACFQYHKEMEPRLVNPRLLKIWRYLGSSDHLYYMFTFGGAPGEVHSYFSPYDTPYDAFITYLSVLMDFDSHIHKDIVQANEPFTFSLGEGRFLKTVYGIKDFIEAVKDIDINSIKYHTTRGDLEKWAKYSLLDQALADRIKKITEKVLDDTELREEIRKAFEDRLRELNSSL